MAANRQNRAGQQTRRALLDAGSRLFTQRGLADLPAAEIAREAGAFPSQVTYYFGKADTVCPATAPGQTQQRVWVSAQG